MDNSPQLEDFDNYQDYRTEVESYVRYNGTSSYDECMVEVEHSNRDYDMRVERESK